VYSFASLSPVVLAVLVLDRRQKPGRFDYDHEHEHEYE
jgi:hypothetical protein